MSNVERIPLLSTTKRFHHSNSNNEIPNGYLLLSVPQTENTSIIQKLRDCGNYAGIIVAISITVIIVILIVGITYHADISELTVTVNNNSIGLKKSSLLFQSGETPSKRYAPKKESRTPMNTEIETPLGKLKGYIRRSRKGRDCVSFYKVPYAKPPIGELRFKDPQPVERWEGIRDNREVAPSCIQKSKHVIENIATGVEDCLYSNIYVPFITGNNSHELPVMVYIHGGGFGDGNGSRFQADYFMDEDVVLITFEYRLGLFGFLNTGDREATGNMGFKDQVMFLKWTRDNIRYFNGDPGRVTIFGNSVGGFSVSFQMISPMSHGLFHRAISQSGTVLCESTLIFDLHPERTKKAAAKAFNCSFENSTVFLNCLKAIPAADLALAHISYPDIKYALTVEHGFDPNNLTDVFMPDKPYNLLKAGKVNKVPYIMGVVSTEWISASLGVLINVEFTEQLNTNFSQFAPQLLEMDLTPEESQAIKSFYFQNNPISNETERNLTNLLSDRVMVHGTKVTAEFHSKQSETYLYYFSKRPAKSYAEKILVDFPSLDTSSVVSHADEVQFLFPYYGYPTYSVKDKEYFPFSEFFVKLWAQFAATGKPRIEGRLTDWKALNIDDTDKSKIWYELNDFTGVTTVLNQRMSFWDQFNHKKMMYDQ